MKYTRVDFKRKNSKGSFFILLILGILILAFISGSIISKLIIKNNNIDINAKSVSEVEGKKIEDSISKNESPNEFFIIQCGVFANKVNAEALRDKLSFAKTPFIIQQEDKYRVILGIHTKTETEEIVKKLEENKIEFSKKAIIINDNDLCNAQIKEIVDARLQIINKFSNEKVKSVQTKQIKEWISSLKDSNEKSSNYAVLNELKEDTKKLPDNLVESDMDKQVAFIYKMLITLK
ncbi:sporulation related domain protein [Clostridium homopropionicum DSM 5847]|uniref:Sporulation related domain protein n=1 Tax=Clostridium homopropionicum DSM 5847 TaxID=1121318 RepID=A0A0L6ZB15_9CLOT|nr:SPOR domain-containing protein [Clostridium homopropionicum]KOA20166.1 sporulation related domain protein [Clostridium homopropionicum DSM 5847]SFG60646.1 Sporulation related domain-containing protein [Clostridium homopropionicum]